MAVTVETTIADVVFAAGAVTAIAGARGYPAVIPIDVDLPAWSYQVISDVPTMAHSGGTGSRTARLQFTATAESFGTAVALANAIEAVLSGYQAGAGASALKIDAVIPEDKYGSFQPTQRAQTMRVDVMVFYIES